MNWRKNKRAAALIWSVAFVAISPCSSSAQDAEKKARRDDGYRGIWYFNQKSDDEYVYKYSGGLGTYCAKHQPFAVHCASVRKTFFCFGGTTKDSFRKLHHLVSYFDHATGQVPRPTILLDKKTGDAHDNPVLTVDASGYLWIFSTSHGRSRPSFVHRSVRPHDISAFRRIDAKYSDGGAELLPLTNFSYFQAWHVPERGFVCFFTRYADPAARTNMFMTSADGVTWSRWQRLAAIEKGHYQISAVGSGKAASTFNYHPDPKGLNWRTNLYYMETSDLGKTWQTVRGEELSIPLTSPATKALVHDYAAESLLVYLKDIRLDGEGRPVILFLTSKGYRSGPANGPRIWRVARWTAKRWSIHPVTTSDNNYDMGSLFLEEDAWRVIGPTGSGPQPFNPGGEVAVFVSRDDGRTWKKEKELTRGSPRNHTYVRRPVNAHPGFYGFWADGHGRQPSASRLYFCTRDGRVFQLPSEMKGEFAKPAEVTPAEVNPAEVNPGRREPKGPGRQSASSSKSIPQ